MGRKPLNTPVKAYPLKGCPFCNKSVEKGYRQDFVFIKCDPCGLQMKEYKEFETVLLERWNIRKGLCQN